jgi:glutamine synthetase
MCLLSQQDGQNTFGDDSNEWGLSSVGRSFLAGQLRHLNSVYAILVPTLNCMKRRRPHTFSPTNVSWGLEDRSSAIRVKSGSAKSRHVENRAPSGMSNPYLVAAALLGSGLLGVEQGLELESPAHAPAEEDPTKTPFPTSVEQSLDLLEGDTEILELLGDDFVRAYTTMRRYELSRFNDYVTDWEREEYLELY